MLLLELEDLDDLLDVDELSELRNIGAEDVDSVLFVDSEVEV